VSIKKRTAARLREERKEPRRRKKKKSENRTNDGEGKEGAAIVGSY